MKINKLTSGSYQCVWYERNRRRRRTFPSKAMAEEFAGQVQYERISGKSKAQRIYYLDTMVRDYLARQTPNVSPRHLQQVERVLTDIKEELHWVVLQDVDTAEILGWLDSRMDTRFKKPRSISKATRNRYICKIRAFFNWAIQEEIMERNPLRNIKLSREGNTRKGFPFLEAEQIHFMMHCLAEEDPQLHDIVVVLLGTGLRRDELIHLEWGDIDQARGMIHVQKKADWSPKWEIERSLPVRDEVLSTILGQPELGRTIFCSKPYQKDRSTDRPLSPEWTLRRLKRVMKQHDGFENIGLHMLRHTYISHLVMNGIDLRTVMQLAGHRHYETTLRYAHLAPAHLRDAVVNGGIKLPGLTDDTAKDKALIHANFNQSKGIKHFG